MSITETVLVFVGIPALVVAAVYGLVYGTTARRASKRYRPGRPFTFAPVWFLAATAHVGTAHVGGPAGSTTRALEDDRRSALSAGAHTDAAAPSPLLAQAADAPTATVAHGETGGASDSW